MRKLVCPTSARQGDIVGVSWDLGPEGEPSSGDWIGLFKQNQPSSTQYVIYKKTGGAKRGIIDVAAPGLGTWEFRFFPNNSYDYVMKSNLLIVGALGNDFAVPRRHLIPPCPAADLMLSSLLCRPSGGAHGVARRERKRDPRLLQAAQRSGQPPRLDWTVQSGHLSQQGVPRPPIRRQHQRHPHLPSAQNARPLRGKSLPR